MIPWHSFSDPDAFYHAHMAYLLLHHGPIRSFPWLDLTTLGTAFADHHFLFHVFEAPFVAIFGWANGARLTAVALGGLFLSLTYACLRWLGIRHPWFWVCVLALTEPLLFRISLAKASPLALTLFVCGLSAAWKRRPVLVGVVALLFALSHGGWLFLVGSLFLISIGDVIYSRYLENASWRVAIRSSLWRECLAAVGGVVLGTIIHPNFPQNISFLWVQIVKIGLETPYAHVILGREWLPMDPSKLLVSFSFWFALLLGGLGALLIASRKMFDPRSARAAIAFAIPVAACVALTFKSQRNGEYLAPAFLLWIPWLWMMVDGDHLMSVLRVLLARSWRAKRMYAILGIMIVALASKNILDVYQSLRLHAYPDTIYSEAMKPVSERAMTGDRVFHSDWDEFPMLFNIDDRLKYVAGLDPTFLYEASSTLSDAYREVTWGKTTTTKAQAWDLIHDRLQAQFVFIDKRDHARLLEVIKSDERYSLLADTKEAATFMVSTSTTVGAQFIAPQVGMQLDVASTHVYDAQFDDATQRSLGVMNHAPTGVL